MSGIVFHAGGLGDSVLCWPLLRRLHRADGGVKLVTRPSLGGLARACLGVATENLDRWCGLWDRDGWPDPRSERQVYWLLGRGMKRALRAVFPGASVTMPTAPLDRVLALELGRDEANVAPCPRPDGPVVIHVGSGGAHKRWPLARFAALAERVTKNRACVMCAGETELEKFTRAERDMFAQCGGRFIADLTQLLGVIRGACAVVANDSGPGHLSAALGVPTLSLFGPTDPSRWAPIGPVVRVVAPPRPAHMEWLDIDVADEALRSLLESSASTITADDAGHRRK